MQLIAFSAYPGNWNWNVRQGSRYRWILILPAQYFLCGISLCGLVGGVFWPFNFFFLLVHFWYGNSWKKDPSIVTWSKLNISDRNIPCVSSALLSKIIHHVIAAFFTVGWKGFVDKIYRCVLIVSLLGRPCLTWKRKKIIQILCWWVYV